jgi:quinoprotein glucose dehydrogenase
MSNRLQALDPVTGERIASFGDNGVVDLREGLISDGTFPPLGRQKTILMPGFEGGAEWGGAAYDPESATLYVNANEIPYTLAMIKLDAYVAFALPD